MFQHFNKDYWTIAYLGWLTLGQEVEKLEIDFSPN